MLTATQRAAVKRTLREGVIQSADGYRAPGIRVLAKSGNRKTGYLAVTYGPIRYTCPDTCPLRFSDEGGDDGPCYAKQHHVGRLNSLLETEATLAKLQPLDLAVSMATGIMLLPADRPLRLMVSGDCPSDDYAAILAEAAAVYTDRNGFPVYGYTHNWRKLDRAAFGAINILASCDTFADVKLAAARGYAAALVTGPHVDKRAVVRDGFRMVPCPSQTIGIHCNSCPSLCMNAGSMEARRAVVMFEPHGTRKGALTRRLAMAAG